MINGAESSWFDVNEVDQIDSPALLIYLDRVKTNIKKLVQMIGDPSRLRPHVKTHKSIEVTQLLMAQGIQKFKCATIAEAEMLGICMAKDVLLAYQPTGPKQDRFLALQQKYPATQFSCLIDDIAVAKALSAIAERYKMIVPVYIDLNVGMDRTGIAPEQAFELGEEVSKFAPLKLVGLHAYDGHIEEIDMAKRTKECLEIYSRVVVLKEQLAKIGYHELTMVMGGSPSFPIYSQLADIECSPGTFVYWDNNYLTGLPEQQFLPAVLLLGRIISKPSSTTLTVDIGHKAVSSEYPLSHRIRFLNAPELSPISHSEEHLVVAAPANHTYQIGDILYGLPFHVCPTCALHEYGNVVEDHQFTQRWKVLARNRTIGL